MHRSVYRIVVVAGLLIGCSSPAAPEPQTDTESAADTFDPQRPPPPVSTPELYFRDITAWAGLDTIGNETATGASFMDWDQDGDLDLLLPVGPDLALMRNRGDGSFERIDTIQFEAAVVYTYVLDLTGDGVDDVLVVDELGAIAWELTEAGVTMRPDLLFVEDFDLLPAVATFGDFTGSGRHDVILGRSFVKIEGRGEPDPQGPPQNEEPAPDVHLRFDGSRYADVSSATGVSSPDVNTLSAMTCDLNSDGRLDLIVGTQHDEPDRYLAMNEQGRFEPIGNALGITSDPVASRIPTSAMGFDGADVDGDLDLDIFVTDDNPAYGSRLYLRGDDGRYTYATESAGLNDTRNLVSWGDALADFNHDGAVDLFIANGRRFLPDGISSPDQENALFFGNGDGTFTRATPPVGSGLDVVLQSFGAIFGDIDGDGDLDTLVLNANQPPTLLRNDMGAAGNWFQVELEHPTLSPAVGAILTLTTDQGQQRRWVHGTPSFGGSSQSAVHFGLGSATEVVEIDVRWPDGATTTHGPFERNQTVRLSP